MEDSMKIEQGGKKIVFDKGEIQFKEVNFGYSGEKSILKNVSFAVQAGQSVAIVGATGAGKSTIMRLIYRFYDIQ